MRASGRVTDYKRRGSLRVASAPLPAPLMLRARNAFKFLYQLTEVFLGYSRFGHLVSNCFPHHVRIESGDYSDILDYVFGQQLLHDPFDSLRSTIFVGVSKLVYFGPISIAETCRILNC